jgi:hypothetical protein
VTEFRWLEKWADESRTVRMAAAKAGIRPTRTRVLQYRTYGDGILMTPEGEQPYRGWSEWRNVPTVNGDGT